ncbi:hypothetical protein BH09SUM1_BH09SUM1_29660 [soil metagenome]
MKPEEKEDTDSPRNTDATRKLLVKKYQYLFDAVERKQGVRTQLVHEMESVEADIRALSARMVAMKKVIADEFPGTVVSERALESWENIPLPDAAGKALAEVGCYLSDSQLRQRLAGHGIEFEDTAKLSSELVKQVTGKSPLTRLSSKLWMRRDWVDQARFSFPKKKEG